jgi:uncharacterized C2H2 Zn-finger protein
MTKCPKKIIEKMGGCGRQHTSVDCQKNENNEPYHDKCPKRNDYIKNPQSIKSKFECIACNYITTNRKDYTKHEQTKKHINLTYLAENPHDKLKIFQCECGNYYHHRQGLYRHRISCRESVTPELTDTITDIKKTIDMTTVMELLRQNQEFKSLMIEQNKQLHESHAHTTDLHRQLIDAVKDGKVCNTITTHHTTNNMTNKFNLNFFLNTTCKDALNMSDFIQNIDIQMDDIEEIGHHGYIVGMTNMILNRLKELDVCKRPMHCTDLKREIVYIKDADRWDKDTAAKSKLRHAITAVARKNYGKIPEWRERNPECLEIGSDKYDFCFKMMRNVLGDLDDEQIRLDNKVIKNLAKQIMVSKNDM